MSFVLLASCLPQAAYATCRTASVELSSEIFEYQSADELFAIRAEMLCKPDTTEEDLAEIDRQLSTLGVEKISATEVEKKLGISSVTPRYALGESSDTSWYSSRHITVWYGQSYEVQIITGQGTTPSSDLNMVELEVTRNYSGSPQGFGNLLKVAADDIVTASVDLIAPGVGTALATGITVYEALDAYFGGLSPTETLSNIQVICALNVATTIKYAFVKYAGNVDNGNQILAYEGNAVAYAAQVTVPDYEFNDEINIPEFDNVSYLDSIIGYGFDDEDCIRVAAENFWIYKNQNQIFDPVSVYHQMTRIPTNILGTTRTITVPWEYPPLIEV